jgi:hypothetical protein
MAEENGWIFVGAIPLVYNKRNVERQQKIQTWLDLYQLVKELNLDEGNKAIQPLDYVS